MIFLAAYPSYEEANERQLDLLAAGIDAKIEYVPNTGERYRLLVEEARVDEAWELIALEADLSAKSIAACPHCGSSAVRELEISLGIDVLLLMLPSCVEYIRSRVSGVRYRCEDCAQVYRKRLGKPQAEVGGNRK